VLLRKLTQHIIVEDRSGVMLVTLLIPTDFFCFYFAGGGVKWCLGPSWLLFLNCVTPHYGHATSLVCSSHCTERRSLSVTIDVGSAFTACVVFVFFFKILPGLCCKRPLNLLQAKAQKCMPEQRDWTKINAMLWQESISKSSHHAMWWSQRLKLGIG